MAIQKEKAPAEVLDGMRMALQSFTAEGGILDQIHTIGDLTPHTGLLVDYFNALSEAHFLPYESNIEPEKQHVKEFMGHRTFGNGQEQIEIEINTQKKRLYVVRTFHQGFNVTKQYEFEIKTKQLIDEESTTAEARDYRKSGVPFPVDQYSSEQQLRTFSSLVKEGINDFLLILDADQ